MEHLGAGRGQGGDALGSFAVRRHLDPDEQARITVLNGLHLGHHAGMVRDLHRRHLRQERVIQIRKFRREHRHQPVGGR